MKYLVGAVGLLCACTVSNPLYLGGAAPDGGGGGGDGFQMAGADLAQPMPHDLAGTCVEGARRCVSTSATAQGTQVCTGGVFVADRLCPAETKCADGYCQPPPRSTTGGITGAPCDQNFGNGDGPQENQCFTQQGTLSCEPFITGATKSVSWICGRAVGMGLPGDPCTQGTTCRTGFCGSTGYCFRACQQDFDCPNNGQGLLQCNEVTIVVDGVQVKAMSCVP